MLQGSRPGFPTYRRTRRGRDTVHRMRLLRTPDDRFDDLTGHVFESHYTEIDDGIRIHHVDEGDGPVVLLMHGEPTWSYLYRAMITPIASAGHRVIAPDLVGFGRSDKPAQLDDHTYERHVSWMLQWLRTLDLDGVTLFCQDWGGLVGLRLVAADPDRFARFAVANTGLPTGDREMPAAFNAWQEYARSTPEFDPGAIVQGGTVRALTGDEVAAYRAPFPDESYLAGPRVMPGLVPTSPDDPSSEPNREAWQTLSRWEKPCLTLFSDSDPITAGGERPFHRLVPGADGQPHQTIAGAGHFLQEDAPLGIARALVDWMR